ncbi:mitochondrial fission ELM1 family protein [Alphaproteobacteria bacterium]|nr:mitochondrial fission ELM1 family protein [Alphaproteobacteria bacterium]
MKNKKNIENITCWIVVEDGLTGTENQCLGVTNALGITPDIKRITLRQPWQLLSPYLRFEQSWSFAPALTPPWPDLVIAAGRKSIAVSRYIKKRSQGKTFTAQIQNPKTSLGEFNLIAAPFHDQLQGDNVITTTAAPNRITPEVLAHAKTDFPEFMSLNSPRIAVLIGGNSSTHTLTKAVMQDLINKLQALDARLMITTSRRTGEKNTQLLQNANLDAYIWDGTGENPYFAMLANADAIIVTNDSVSMLSDAGTTGKPVYIVELEGGSPKFNRLYKILKDNNVIRTFNGSLEDWHYEPLNDAQMIANEIKRRMDLS